MFNWPAQPDPEKDLRVIEAEIWVRRSKDYNGVGLEDVLSVARRQHEQAIEVNRRLDGKAEWMFTIASAAAGVVIVYWEKTQVEIIWSVIPLAAFLCSMWLSMIGRAPAKQFGELSIDQAINSRRAAPDQYNYWMSSQLYVAITAMAVVNVFKANMINYAARAVVVGVLLIAGVIGFCHLGCYSVVRPRQQPQAPSEACSAAHLETAAD